MNQQHSMSHEDMLIALDQLDQTVEVMSQIIRRLKQTVDQSISSTSPLNPPQETRSSSLLHTETGSDIAVDNPLDSNLH